MNGKLAIAFFLLTIGFSMPVLLGIRAVPDIQLPNLHTDYQPEQPISFSHRLHAGVLNIDCQYCHTGADKGRHATIPNLQTCMNCHEQIEGRTETAKERIAELTAAYSPDPKTRKRKNVAWLRVHNNPDFVYFNHQAHVRIATHIDDDGNIHEGIDCTVCHGEMRHNGVAKQQEQLAMGWCINCHREQNDRALTANLPANAPVNACDACHR